MFQKYVVTMLECNKQLGKVRITIIDGHGGDHDHEDMYMWVNTCGLTFKALHNRPPAILDIYAHVLFPSYI